MVRYFGSVRRLFIGSIKRAGVEGTAVAQLGTDSQVLLAEADQFSDVGSEAMTFDDRVPVKGIDAERGLAAIAIVLAANEGKNALGVFRAKGLFVAENNLAVEVIDDCFFVVKAAGCKSFLQCQGKGAGMWICKNLAFTILDTGLGVVSKLDPDLVRQLICFDF
jgi:hypothetical protein